MKNFKITVVNQKTKQPIVEFIELSNTKKYLESKMRARYQFHDPKVTVKIERLIRPLGVKMNIKNIFDEPAEQR